MLGLAFKSLLTHEERRIVENNKKGGDVNKTEMNTTGEAVFFTIITIQGKHRENQQMLIP